MPIAMARKKYQEEPENHERWLVSYADFITLLFAFFVVMYAISSVNEGKYRVLSNALGSAFGRVPPAPPAVREKELPAIPALPLRLLPLQKRHPVDAALRREREQMTGIARSLLKALAPLVSQGTVRVTQTLRGVSVEINASVLFAPGEARLSSESSQALKAVALVLKDDTHAIQVEGHTDNMPIGNTLFPSNWELSAVRASSVVRLFVDNGIADNRLVAVGHGSNQPVGSNDTAAGRLRNRRVELMILSGLPDVATEVPVGSAQGK
ncbi:MAG: motB1 [Herminiimonas sp.]|nr:motB1 [Herminiimonas sp.]